MNEQQLQEIEARCDALHGKPWVSSRQYGTLLFVLNQANEIMAKPATKEIGDFIAASASDIPALIAALREAWNKISELKEAQDECK